MKHVLLALAVTISALLSGCKGPDGPTGPIGPIGAVGLPGKDAAQPAVYDYTVDMSKSLIIWNFPKSLEAYDIPFTYIMANKGTGYSMLPFKSFAYTSDQKDFIKLDTWFLNYDSFLSFRNETSVPTGATFWMRTVVIKGVKGGRIDVARYRDYANLKADFNLRP